MRFRFILILILIANFYSWGQTEEIFSWEDCLLEAQKNHPDLIYAIEGINVQKANKNITTSSVYPQIDSNLKTSTTKTTSRTDSYSYGVSGTQLLFDGLKTPHDIQSSKENLKAAQENYRFTSAQVRGKLRTAFVNLLKAQELIRVAEEIVKIRRENLVLITLRYQSGLEHKGAMLTAEANLASANFELSQAKREVRYVQRELAAELGRETWTSFSIKGDFSVREDSQNKPDFDNLAENNPSVRQSIAQKNSASFAVKSTYGDFSPKLTASAGADKKGSDWTPKDDQWNLGLTMTMPLFEGGARIAEVAKAQAQYKQAEANERSQRNSAMVNLEKTWAAFQDAVETVGVKQKSLEASIERSKIAEAQYSTGFINFDNWIIIENDLVNAKKAYLNAQSNALLAEANWIEAKGETLEYAQQN